MPIATEPPASLLAAIRRVLLGKEKLSREALRADLERRGILKKRHSDDVVFKAALSALETEGEIELVEDHVRPADLHLRNGSPMRAETSGLTLLGQIRRLLRENPVIERAELRAQLRAIRKIGGDGDGSRRVYRWIKYLQARGEIAATPTHAIAVDVMPKRKRPSRKGLAPEGSQNRRIRLAKRRERALGKRVRMASDKTIAST